MSYELTVKGNGVCQRVVLTLSELTVKEDFLPLELGSLDMVLGMQWLQTMEKMEADWPMLTLKFDRGGKEIVIKGDPFLARLEVSMKRLAKQWENQDEGYLVELHALSTHPDEDDEMKETLLPIVEELVHEYLDIF